MGQKTLELTIISAKDLKDVNLIGKMDVYVVVSLSDNPKSKQKTPIHQDGGKNPSWNYTMRFTIDDQTTANPNKYLTFQLKHEYSFGADKELGEVRVSIKELLDGFSGKDQNAPMFLTYQVKRHSGKAQGELKFSYKFVDMGYNKPSGSGGGYAEPLAQSYPPPPKGSDGCGAHAAPQMGVPYAGASGGHPPYGGYPPSGSGGYPPPQAGYPPPGSGGYPPPQAGYPPPESGGYPSPPAGYPPLGSGYPPPPAGYPQPGPSGYPPAHVGYPPPGASGYPPPPGGYPPQASGGYGYPPPAGYPAYPPAGYAQQPVQKPKKGNKFGMGLGAGLIGGALGGLVLGEMVDDAFDGGFDDGGGFDF